MNDKAEERPLSKFSHANRAAYATRVQETGNATANEGGSSSGQELPLAHFLEHMIRDGGLPDPERPASEVIAQNYLMEQHSQPLPPRLIEELQAAQEKVWVSPAAAANEDESLETSVDRVLALLHPDSPKRPDAPIKERLFAPVSVMSKRGLQGLRIFSRYSMHLARSMRLHNWHRRYFNTLTWLHRHIFDRRVERLLFIETPGLLPFPAATENEPKIFVYQGPLPSRVLNWAFSALPNDLKRYAFVDFGALNGRTLLLAARRNFECAFGYAFDRNGSEELEMNIAQYSRSYMSCRNVRALRGDEEGFAIPSQPAVLFFPDSLRDGHFDIVMSHVSASYRLNPRPLYLIFENAGPGQILEQKDIFQRQPLPLLNRIKVALFSPAKVVVYRSIESESIS